MTDRPGTPDPLPAVSIGSVLAFAADVTNQTIAATLAEEGWLPCLGQSLSTSQYADLFAVIGRQFGGKGDQFNLPDLRGLFVRGAYADLPAGTLQQSATAPPVRPFITSEDGAHTHSVSNLPSDSVHTYYTAGHNTANNSSGSTSEAGNHTHQIVAGGDNETRPVNLYVDYIIKYKESGGQR